MPRWTICLVAFSWMFAAASSAQDRDIDFNRDIRPILSNRCYTCHGPDDATREADLRLDAFEAATEDRDGVRAVNPGRPEDSELIRRVLAEDDEQMPPAESGQRLSKAEVQLLRDWIRQGAKYAQHWSFERPVRRPAPKVKSGDRIHSAIDQYVLAQLEKQGLKFSPAADRRTQIRRVTLDLTGRPPTWDEVEQFVNDKDPKAYERLVDRLLKSDAYGERWAAMWLDLARYADSAGYANDPPRTIWMYRDWVIQAFNKNMPFDQFTVEQLAGDLLPNPTNSQRIATAFHRNTLTNSEGGTNDEEFRNVAIVDRVNTTMQVWMGLTIRCAQCHNHKYDPLTQEEYFRIFAFFNNTADADRANESPVLQVFSEDQEIRRAKLQQQIDDLKQQLTPSGAELAQQVAAWESAYRAPKWRTIEPQTLRAASGASLEVDEHGAIRVRGAEAKTDTYELEFDAGSEAITALRVEALRDEELPKNGPGRSNSGRFVLSEIQLTAGPADESPRVGRFVRVELPGPNKFLHLAEVQAFSGADNLALKGKAKQSSTGFGGAAQRAIDGNTSGNYTDNSVSHTASGDKSPWWEVDLGEAKPIDRVVIWNRTDSNLQSRLNGYVVSLLDEKRNVVWTKKNPTAPQREAELALGGLSLVPLANASETGALPKDGGIPFVSWAASAAIDGDAKGAKWGWSAPVGENHAAAFVTKSPLRFEKGAKLKLVLKQNRGEGQTLGRFRISVSADKSPVRLLRADLERIVSTPAKERTPEDRKRLTAYVRKIAKPPKKVVDQIAALEKRLKAIKAVTTPVMVELAAGKRRTTKIQIRGNFMVTSDVVTEGTPEVLHKFPAKAPKTRLEFAKWLVARDNPLTARVVVNRYWEQLFGQGIVATSEEFGTQGDLPSHPELLDHLALDLMDNGWDIKRLLKTIVLSTTYRQSSAASPELVKLDPSNRWLARGPRFRLSAEMIRDQALAVSGLLSGKMYGPSVRPPRPKLGLKAAFGGSTDWETSPGEDRYRRALYTSWRRSLPYPSMATFDAPTRNVCTIRRGRTNTPLQALVTLNDPVYVEAAQALARRIASHEGDVAAKAAHGFQLASCRLPSKVEAYKLTRLYELARKRLQEQPDMAKRLATEPLGPMKTEAETDYVDLAAWTAVANVILNLDEVLVKH